MFFLPICAFYWYYQNQFSFNFNQEGEAMNSAISEKIKPTDDITPPVSSIINDEREKRVAAMKAEFSERIAQRIEESKTAKPLSKEERERRRLNMKAIAERATKEAREKGLTDEILEELLKDV
jgi:hypothetical protein